MPEPLKDIFIWATQGDFLWKLVAVSIILIIGFPLVSFAAKRIRILFSHRISVQAGMLARKFVSYLGYTLMTVLVLQQFGVKLGAMLGAAGIGGVAIGFASRTSLSNIISGIFLIGEKPFEIDDFIEVDGISGKIDTIGLLSLTLRTHDNRAVRIPNETLVKTKVINFSRYPIRRYNMNIGVSYDHDIKKILTILQEIAAKNVYCLDEPAPLVTFDNFGESSQNFILGAWAISSEIGKVKNSLAIELKQRFDKEGIEIPYPHLTIVKPMD